MQQKKSCSKEQLFFILSLICINLIASVRMLFQNKYPYVFTIKNNGSIRINFAGSASKIAAMGIACGGIEAIVFFHVINSNLEPGDTVVFEEEGIFENGAPLMKYDELEKVIENRNVFMVCDGKKLLVLRKADLVSGSLEDFEIFIEAKTEEKIEKI